MSTVTTKFVEIGDASYSGGLTVDGTVLVSNGGGLTVNGTVLAEGGTMIVGEVGTDGGGALGLINATLNAYLAPSTNLMIGLMGSSALNIDTVGLSPMSFLSPVVLASEPSAINVDVGAPDFAGVAYDAQTHMMEFVSTNNTILAALRIYNEVPGTTWSTTTVYATQPGETVTLGLVPTHGHSI